MPYIVTGLHDGDALAAACRELGLRPPRRAGVRPGSAEAAGCDVRLPGVLRPVVCDLRTGQVEYDRRDNAFERFRRIMLFLCRCAAVQARRRWTHDEAAGRTRRRCMAAG